MRKIVKQFKEKPALAVAEEYFRKGPDRYLWNSGMFVWHAATLLDCISRLEPDVYAGLAAIAQAWDTPERDAVLAEIYPTLKKISIDFAVMEPASRLDAIQRGRHIHAIELAGRRLVAGICPNLPA